MFFCAVELAVFQELHEAIWGQEKLAKVLVQHRLAYVLTGMGLSERNKIWAAARITERSCRTRFPLFGGIAELPETADEPPPRDLRGELRHHLKLEHTLPSDQTKQCLGLRGR